MKNTCKIYEENGVRYQFASKKLLVQINQKKFNAQSIGEKLTKGTIMNELADMQHVSVEAVKNWMYGYNGPADIEQVIELGRYFEIDYHELLEKEEEKMEENTKITGIITDWQAQYTKDRIREIYHAMLSCFERCRYYHRKIANGMTYDEMKEMGKTAQTELYAMYNNAYSKLEYAMLDIPEAMYNKLEEYFWADLSEYIDRICVIPEEPELTQEEWDNMEVETDPTILHDWEEADRVQDEFFNGGYKKELRKLFNDYVVE